MSVAMWVSFALCVGMAAGFFIGHGVSRDSDTLTIASLRDALSDTQEQLTEAWFAKAEAVAAQEAAERTLKEQFARRSDGSKRAWVTRKSNADVSRAS